MPANVEIWGSFEDRMAREMEDAAGKCRRGLQRKQWIEKWAPELPDQVRIHMGAYDLMWNVVIEFPRECLPEMRRVLGRCTVAGKDVASVKDNTIYVYLNFPKCEGADLFTFKYVRELSQDSKCKIVGETCEPSERTTYSLQCSLS